MSRHPAWVRPPMLRAGEETEQSTRRASWLELFFDLVFVMAVSELARQLVLDHTPTGFVRFAAMFVPVWEAWLGFSFYADRFDTDDVPTRCVMLAGMLGVSAMTVEIPFVAQGGRTHGFALAYAAIGLLIVALNLRAYRHVPVARPLVGRYALSFLLGSGLWLISLLVPRPQRFMFWAVGVLVEALAPVLSARHMDRVPVNRFHVPERLALLTLIVLGESVVAVGTTSVGELWRAANLTAAVAGFLVVGCLWWLYFDVVEGNRLGPSRLAGLAYVHGHVPLLLALAAVGAGVRLVITAAPQGVMDVGTRMALGGGVTLALVMMTAVQLVTAHPVAPAVARTRLLIAATAGTVTLGSGVLGPVGLPVCLFLVLVVQVAVETARAAPPEQ